MSEVDAEAPRERRTGKIGLQLFVDRIELARITETQEPELDWSVSAHSVEHDDITSVVLVGHLFRIAESGMGQVRAVAGLPIETWVPGEDQLQSFIDEFAYGYVESLYDTCRRALLMQSIQMEMDLDIPVHSPACVIEIHDESEETATSAVQE